MKFEEIEEDGGDVELEEWEEADALLALNGMSERDREAFWNEMDKS